MLTEGSKDRCKLAGCRLTRISWQVGIAGKDAYFEGWVLPN